LRGAASGWHGTAQCGVVAGRATHFCYCPLPIAHWVMPSSLAVCSRFFMSSYAVCESVRVRHLDGRDLHPNPNPSQALHVLEHGPTICVFMICLPLAEQSIACLLNVMLYLTSAHPAENRVGLVRFPLSARTPLDGKVQATTQDLVQNERPSSTLPCWVQWSRPSGSGPSTMPFLLKENMKRVSTLFCYRLQGAGIPGGGGAAVPQHPGAGGQLRSGQPPWATHTRGGAGPHPRSAGATQNHRSIVPLALIHPFALALFGGDKEPSPRGPAAYLLVDQQLGLFTTFCWNHFSCPGSSCSCVLADGGLLCVVSAPH
jgi:hypothetical protein